MVVIESLKYPRYAHPFYQKVAGWAAYAHQAALSDRWDQFETFLLSTKTGSGKTAAAVSPIVQNRESAMLLYPTNALLQDQAYSIAQMLQEFQVSAEEGNRRNLRVYRLPVGADQVWDWDRIAMADVLIVRVEGTSLEKLRRQFGSRTKGRVVDKLLQLDKPVLFLSNPDTLFLLLTMRYKEAESHLAQLLQFSTLVVDEFHLYHGTSLAKLLFMIHVCRRLLSFQRTVLLSATPSPKVADLVDLLFDDVCMMSQKYSEEAAASHRKVDERKVMHQVDLSIREVGEGDIEVIAEHLTCQADELSRARVESSDDRYVPAVVILNSVQAAIYLEDLLRRRGVFQPRELGVYRGLMSQKARSFRGKTIVLGTSAVEVGVDFDCSYLYFEAWDLGSFMQRLGRLARSRPGTATYFARHNEAAGLAGFERGQVTRAEFEKRVSECFERADSMAWLVDSKRGLQVVRLSLEELLQTVEKKRTHLALREIFKDYASRLECERVGRIVDMSVQKQRLNWITPYRRAQTFRGGLPSVSVYDAREERRRGQGMGKYRVGFHTLLSRANIKRFSESGSELMVEIAGYEKWSQPGVKFSTSADMGEIAALPEDLYFTTGQKVLDGRFNQLFGKDHIYTIVPLWFGKELDWRLKSFVHPRGMVYFDDDALTVSALLRKFDHENGCY